MLQHQPERGQRCGRGAGGGRPAGGQGTRGRPPQHRTGTRVPARPLQPALTHRSPPTHAEALTQRVGRERRGRRDELYRVQPPSHQTGARATPRPSRWWQRPGRLPPSPRAGHGSHPRPLAGPCQAPRRTNHRETQPGLNTSGTSSAAGGFATSLLAAHRCLQGQAGPCSAVGQHGSPPQHTQPSATPPAESPAWVCQPAAWRAVQGRAQGARAALQAGTASLACPRAALGHPGRPLLRAAPQGCADAGAPPALGRDAADAAAGGSIAAMGSGSTTGHLLGHAISIPGHGGRERSPAPQTSQPSHPSVPSGCPQLLLPPLMGHWGSSQQAPGRRSAPAQRCPALRHLAATGSPLGRQPRLGKPQAAVQTRRC